VKNVFHTIINKNDDPIPYIILLLASAPSNFETTNTTRITAITVTKVTWRQIKKNELNSLMFWFS
jgi:hypothetical protein